MRRVVRFIEDWYVLPVGPTLAIPFLLVIVLIVVASVGDIALNLLSYLP